MEFLFYADYLPGAISRAIINDDYLLSDVMKNLPCYKKRIFKILYSGLTEGIYQIKILY